MIESAIELLSPLKALLTFFQKERHHLDGQERLVEEKRKEALLAMLTALTATRRYLELSPDLSNREQELELSHLWAVAAVKSQGYCNVMVSVNTSKARYYANRIKWSREEVIARGIDLASIEERIHALIEAA